MYSTDDEEIDVLRALVKSKELFRFKGKNTPSQCSLFEDEFSKYLNIPHSLILSSGTNALVTALQAQNIGPGDEVIVPSFTFFATVAAVVQVQAVPIIVNIDQSLTLDPQECEKQITSRTKGIIPVHMDGLPSAMAEILTLAKKYNLAVIEDVAQAMGGEYGGQKLGTLGDFGCFSFNVDKTLSCGEGGAVVSRHAEKFKRAQLTHDTCSQFGATWRESFAPSDCFIGYSMRVSELSGAMMRAQLKKINPILDKLRSTKRLLIERLESANVDYVKSHCPKGDSATSLHLKFGDAQKAILFSRKMMEQDVKAIPISIRPAHAVWQWAHLLRDEKFIHPMLNPFLHSDRKPKEIYHPMNFLATTEYLTTTIKIPVPFDFENDQLEELAKLLIKTYSEIN